MPNIMPANNVVAGAVAGAVVTIGQHYMVNYGIQITPDVSNSLTVAVSVGVAHLWDVMTGQNVSSQTQGQMTPPPEPKP